MVKVKICGITNVEDGLAAAEAGADALGFVFAPSSRQLTPQQAERIIAALPPLVFKVGVFVDASLEEVRQIMAECNLDLAQLHGEESPQCCQALFPRAIKAFRVKDSSFLSLLPQYRVVAYLLDSYNKEVRGGSGQAFDWSIACAAKAYGRIILSGGLTPENVSQAIAQVHPYGVDVSSGVESRPGRKDYGKLRAFIEAAKSAGSSPESCSR